MPPHTPVQHTGHLPALTGIRFFAIFHIFLHHVWATYTYYSQQQGSAEGLFNSLNHAPHGVMVFLSNGWVSTSLFFMLSGFILAYLYWHPDGHLKVSRKGFWIQRFARIYPIHILVVLLLIGIKWGTYVEQGQSLAFLTGSALATASLTQAWYPGFIPTWSWPTWTISVMVFLYLVMPLLIKLLNTLSERRQKILLFCMPLVSALPAVIYASHVATGGNWSWNAELFFNNFPLFWLPYFVAGMLLTRVFNFNRETPLPASAKFIAPGDWAFLVIVAIACVPDLSQSTKAFLRYGLFVPLYMLVIVDLAKGQGLLARLASLKLATRLGELGFSIFIWQSVVVALAFISVAHYPGIGDYQLVLAIVGILCISAISTDYFEKPVARWLRRLTQRD